MKVNSANQTLSARSIWRVQFLSGPSLFHLCSIAMETIYTPDSYSMLLWFGSAELASKGSAAARGSIWDVQYSRPKILSKRSDKIQISSCCLSPSS
ncbi:hypothetical protein PGT21_002553 [Puccinia graminis f. sp. tritici]|uniref:Uncharacterized protein n=1 Tax=Puccinia graminis f. sp. tritici TaxID=56615 RepID=A0A5B0P1F4_PUCGR|nr:hypothetical protein PGT21_002553 [Puccinia graminis f. sp. tritici]